ncbi:family 2 glycosyl transferase [Candidatus Magnetoovum chiemensis]|nr:family 2 glycosyl transferase [Candidatus Magnetoovum chiemensis]
MEHILMDISISIVTYNSEKVIVNCLTSVIEHSKGLSSEIIVIDNASEDKTAEVITENYPEVRLIRNGQNIGFGRAHNQAFRLSSGRQFLILNPDTVIYDRAIVKLLEFMDREEKAGAAGCKIWWDKECKFMFPDLTLHSLSTVLLLFTPFCRYFPENALAKRYWHKAHKIWLDDKPQTVDGVTGGIIIVRREVFSAIGGFDERFFLFFEEHDLLKRIKPLGCNIYYLPHIQIRHIYEDSCGKCSFDIGKVYRESALYYYRKHYGVIGNSLIRLSFKLTSYLNDLRTKYINKTIAPDKEGNISISWTAVESAVKYIVEVSYSADFCDRAAAVTEAVNFSVSADILNHLPNRRGYLRVIPVFSDQTTGNVIETVIAVTVMNENAYEVSSVR